MSLTQERIAGSVVPAQRPQGSDTASWRAMLESRWRDRLQELTRRCVAFHETGARSVQDGPVQASLRRLMRQAVRARQALAETDDALRRLAGGTFGYCEDCAAQIQAALLLITPEARYCDRCRAS
jgi:DnaK suppressor protein